MTTTTRYTPLLLFEKERNDAVVVVVVVGSIGVSFAFLSLLLFMRERECREECRFELDENVGRKQSSKFFFFDDFNLGFYGIQNLSSFPFLSFPFLSFFLFFWRLLKSFRFWILFIIKDDFCCCAFLRHDFPTTTLTEATTLTSAEEENEERRFLFATTTTTIGSSSSSSSSSSSFSLSNWSG